MIITTITSYEKSMAPLKHINHHLPVAFWNQGLHIHPTSDRGADKTPTPKAATQSNCCIRQIFPMFKLDIGAQYKPPQSRAQSLILAAFLRITMVWGSWGSETQQRWTESKFWVLNRAVICCNTCYLIHEMCLISVWSSRQGWSKLIIWNWIV